MDIVRRYSQFIIHYFHAREGLNNEAIHKYALSSGIIKRIDNFKEENDFITRTQAIIYLIQFSLKKLEKPGLK
ncbi:hypothetical protein ACFQDF_32610 [Ectobacillus funiculus]